MNQYWAKVLQLLFAQLAERKAVDATAKAYDLLKVLKDRLIYSQRP